MIDDTGVHFKIVRLYASNEQLARLFGALALVRFQRPQRPNMILLGKRTLSWIARTSRLSIHPWRLAGRYTVSTKRFL